MYSSGTSEGEHNVIVVFVDTSDVSPGLYTENISVVSNAGTLSIQVSGYVEDFGPQYVNRMKAITVFTYRQEKFPQDKIDLLCDSPDPSCLPYISQLYKEQAENYGVDFELSINFLKDQIELPDDVLLSVGQPYLHFENTIVYLRNKLPSLADYNTFIVFYYLPYDFSFRNGAIPWLSAAFIYVKQPIPGYYYPSFPSDTYSRTVAHELAHLLGADDKYYEGPEKATLTDPATGLPYD